jgi:hypothetical protein
LVGLAILGSDWCNITAHLTLASLLVRLLTSLIVLLSTTAALLLTTLAALLILLIGLIGHLITPNYSLFGTRNNAALKSNVSSCTKHPWQNAASRRLGPLKNWTLALS